MPQPYLAPAPAPYAALRDVYERDGFVVVRGLFTATEMEEAAAEADALLGRRELIATRNLRCCWQTTVQTGECQFETFDPVIDIGPACRRLATDARLLGLLAELYGDAACLFKD